MISRRIFVEETPRGKVNSDFIFHTIPMRILLSRPMDENC